MNNLIYLSALSKAKNFNNRMFLFCTIWAISKFFWHLNGVLVSTGIHSGNLLNAFSDGETSRHRVALQYDQSKAHLCKNLLFIVLIWHTCQADGLSNMDLNKFVLKIQENESFFGSRKKVLGLLFTTSLVKERVLRC